MLVADVGGEEFVQPHANSLPAASMRAGESVRGDGNELIHAVSALAGSNGIFA